MCAQHLLVGEAIAAALREEGFDPTQVPWLDVAWWTQDSVLPMPVLLLGELDEASGRDDVVRVVATFGAQCLLLTSTPKGPSWGAVLLAGAGSVLHSEAPVDHLAREIRRIASGSVWKGRQRATLVQEWRDHLAVAADRRRRMALLTPRESTVLGLLHDGTPVDGIADLLAVGEATISAQVRRILRKLQLDTQLAAVAMYAEHRRDDGDDRR